MAFEDATIQDDDFLVFRGRSSGAVASTVIKDSINVPVDKTALPAESLRLAQEQDALNSNADSGPTSILPPTPSDDNLRTGFPAQNMVLQPETSQSNVPAALQHVPTYGHTYQTTHVSGGTNIQGDVHGIVHIHHHYSVQSLPTTDSIVEDRTSCSTRNGRTSRMSSREPSAADDYDIGKKPRVNRLGSEVVDTSFDENSLERGLSQPLEALKIAMKTQDGQSGISALATRGFAGILKYISKHRPDPNKEVSNSQEPFYDLLIQAARALRFSADIALLEDWELNAISSENQSSLSFAREEKTKARQQNVSSKHASYNSHRMSWNIDSGRLDIFLSTKRENASSHSRFMKDTQLTAVYTPASISDRSRQLRCSSRTIQTFQGLSIRPANIQIRNVIPASAEVFSIIENGTVNSFMRHLATTSTSIYDCDHFGNSMLAHAMWTCNSEIVKFLLLNGADPDTYEPFRQNTTVLIPTIVQRDFNFFEAPQDEITKNAECLNAMIEAGADLSNTIDNTFSICDHIMFDCSIHSFRCALDYGQPFITPNSCPCHDKPPILVLMEKAEINLNGGNGIHIDAKIELLLSRGANPDVKDEYGDNLLRIVLGVLYNDDFRPVHLRLRDVAAGAKHRHIQHLLMLLLTAGADVYAEHPEDGATASDIAYRHDREDVWMEALLDCGYELEHCHTRATKCPRFKIKPGKRSSLTLEAYLAQTRASFDDLNWPDDGENDRHRITDDGDIASDSEDLNTESSLSDTDDQVLASGVKI